MSLCEGLVFSSYKLSLLWFNKFALEGDMYHRKFIFSAFNFDNDARSYSFFTQTPSSEADYSKMFLKYFCSELLGEDVTLKFISK